MTLSRGILCRLGLYGKCLLVGGGGSRWRAGAEHAHRAPEQEDEREEGQGLLFGWSRHGTNVAGGHSRTSPFHGGVGRK